MVVVVGRGVCSSSLQHEVMDSRRKRETKFWVSVGGSGSSQEYIYMYVYIYTLLGVRHSAVGVTVVLEKTKKSV